MTLIRQIRADDWQKLKTLRLEAVRLHPEAFGATYESELSKSDEQWQERARECAHSKDNAIIVADNQCQLVGMVGLYREQGKHAHVGHIWGVYVQADFRGRNLGCALMRETLACARRMKGLLKLRLQVNAINTPAYKLYLANGFKETGRTYKEMRVDDQFYDIVLMEMFVHD